MAVERLFATDNRDVEVDAIDLFKLCSRQSPHWRPRDRWIESLNRKIDRFVMPMISGRNMTSSLAIDDRAPPDLPATYCELRDYELDGAKIGLAVLSSVSSLTTIQFPSRLEEFGPALTGAWRCAHRSFQIGQAVRRLGYDQVLIFNGRHCYSRPFCDLLDNGSSVIRYEQGSAGNRYVSAAGSVHEPDAVKRLIDAHPFDPKAGEAFFIDRLSRHRATDVSVFTAMQRSGSLPREMRSQAVVTLFTSASDEMFAVTDGALYGAFRTQYDVALALADICHADGLQLVVRLHPHLRFKHPAWKKEWDFEELRKRGVLIVSPEDPADSYAVVRASGIVVTTGSTIGIEASYLGVPNAVVGNWIGGRIGASACVQTKDDLAAFIRAPFLAPSAHEAALRFGSFYRTAGRLLPELDVGEHPNLARLDGRIVDPVRYAVQKGRRLLRPGGDPLALDIRSGMQAGRVLLPPGTDYSSALARRT